MCGRRKSASPVLRAGRREEARPAAGVQVARALQLRGLFLTGGTPYQLAPQALPVDLQADIDDPGFTRGLSTAVGERLEHGEGRGELRELPRAELLRPREAIEIRRFGRGAF